MNRSKTQRLGRRVHAGDDLFAVSENRFSQTKCLSAICRIAQSQSARAADLFAVLVRTWQNVAFLPAFRVGDRYFEKSLPSVYLGKTVSECLLDTTSRGSSPLVSTMFSL